VADPEQLKPIQESQSNNAKNLFHAQVQKKLSEINKEGGEAEGQDEDKKEGQNVKNEALAAGEDEDLTGDAENPDIEGQQMQELQGELVDSTQANQIGGAGT